MAETNPWRRIEQLEARIAELEKTMQRQWRHYRRIKSEYVTILRRLPGRRSYAQGTVFKVPPLLKFLKLHNLGHDPILPTMDSDLED